MMVYGTSWLRLSKTTHLRMMILTVQIYNDLDTEFIAGTFCDHASVFFFEGRPELTSFTHCDETR